MVSKKVDITTEELLAEAIDLLEDTKNKDTGNLAVRKSAIELLMKAKGMLIEKRQEVENVGDFIKAEEERKKAQGSDLKIVEMPKNE